MSDDDFLRAMAASACADDIRLVYADWLEERGDVRAEYLRLVAEITALAEKQLPYTEQRRRLLELSGDIAPAWRQAAGQRFDLLLESVQPDCKISVIFLLRELTGCDLRQAMI